MSWIAAGKMPVPEVSVPAGLEPFWDALAEGQLRIPYERATGDAVWYPRVASAAGPLELEWRSASGRGVVHSATVVRRPAGPYREFGPYVLAYVTLDEGPRLMSHLVDVDTEADHIGARVRAVVEVGTDGARILRFAPDIPAGGAHVASRSATTTISDGATLTRMRR